METIKEFIYDTSFFGKPIPIGHVSSSGRKAIYKEGIKQVIEEDGKITGFARVNNTFWTANTTKLAFLTAQLEATTGRKSHRTTIVSEEALLAEIEAVRQDKELAEAFIKAPYPTTGFFVEKETPPMDFSFLKALAWFAIWNLRPQRRIFRRGNY